MRVCTSYRAPFFYQTEERYSLDLNNSFDKPVAVILTKDPTVHVYKDNNYLIELASMANVPSIGSKTVSCLLRQIECIKCFDSNRTMDYSLYGQYIKGGLWLYHFTWKPGRQLEIKRFIGITRTMRIERWWVFAAEKLHEPWIVHIGNVVPIVFLEPNYNWWLNFWMIVKVHNEL